MNNSLHRTHPIGKLVGESVGIGFRIFGFVFLIMSLISLLGITTPSAVIWTSVLLGAVGFFANVMVEYVV